MARIVNARTLAQEKADRKAVERVTVYEDGIKSLHSASKVDFAVDVVITEADWFGTAGHEKNSQEMQTEKGRIVNSNQFDREAAARLMPRVFVDITRQRALLGDLTNEIATEMNDPNYPQNVSVKQMYGHVAYQREVVGSGDSVGMMDRKSGEEESFKIKIYAQGDEQTLESYLFEGDTDISRVNKAVAEADVDQRNHDVIGPIVGANYGTGTDPQFQGKETTAGKTYEVLLHKTLKKALKKLRALKDPLTGDTIQANQVSILVNSSDRDAIAEVVEGLVFSTTSSGNPTMAPMGKIGIDNIIEYNHGATHGLIWNEQKLDYPGVEENVAYIFVPKVASWVATKRGLTMETGPGGILKMERADSKKIWYRAQGKYNKPFLGGAGGGKAGTGYVVKIELPKDA